MHQLEKVWKTEVRVEDTVLYLCMHTYSTLQSAAINEWHTILKPDNTHAYISYLHQVKMIFFMVLIYCLVPQNPKRHENMIEMSFFRSIHVSQLNKNDKRPETLEKLSLFYIFKKYGLSYKSLGCKCQTNQSRMSSLFTQISVRSLFSVHSSGRCDH